MATVTEKVQEALVGTTEEPQLGQIERATFLKHARQDENGEHYLDEESFVNAVAPESEDYVSTPRFTCAPLRLTRASPTAQDQAFTIWNPLQDRRPKAQRKGKHARLDSI